MEQVEKKRTVNKALNNEDSNKFIEIYHKLITALNIVVSKEVKQECKAIFSDLYNESQKKTKYEQSDWLIPTVIYIVLKKRGFNVRTSDFIEHMGVDKKEFFESYKRVVKLYPAFQKRDKQEVVIKKIKNLKVYFHLEDEFLVISGQILHNFWSFIQYAKEDICVGLISIFVLIQMDISSPNFNEICKYLGISMGSMNNRVKKLMKDTLRVENFESLKKSSDLIKDVIIANEHSLDQKFSIKMLDPSLKLEDQLKFAIHQIEILNKLFENKSFLLLKENLNKIKEFISSIKKLEFLEIFDNNQLNRFIKLVNYATDDKNSIENHVQRSRYAVKTKILNYLEKNKFFEYYGILSYFHFRFSTTLPRAIDKLIEEKRITIFRFGEVDLFILHHTEEEVQKKIEIIKFSILKIIISHGIIEPHVLRKRIKEDIEACRSLKFIKSLIADLISEKKIFIETYERRKIYYSKLAPNYEKKLEKKIEGIKKKVYFSKIMSKGANFYSSLENKYGLNSEEKEILEDLISKCLQIIFKNDFTGRKIYYCFPIFSKFLVKKEIFSLLNKKTPFKNLFPLLCLHEILLKECFVDCSHKIYEFYKNLILKDPKFCNESNGGEILNTPNKDLRMKYSLYHNGVTEEVVEKVLRIIRDCDLKGYNFGAKDINGITAAGYYIYSLREDFGKSQREIARQFSISEVTFRNRFYELNQCLPGNNSVKTRKPRTQELGRAESHRYSKKAVVRGLMSIVEDYVEKYGGYYKFQEFMKDDYNAAMQRRIEIIEIAHDNLHYDDLDNDIIFKDLVDKKKVKAQILQKIEEVAKKNVVTDPGQVLDLFLIILAIKDFALGGNAVEIADSFKVTPSYILNTVAKYIFNDSNLYKCRFYSNQNLQKNMISVADDVSARRITESSFQHLQHAQFQEILNYYRRKKGISIGSPVFEHVGIHLAFAQWVYTLPSTKYEQILKDYPDKLSISDLISLISEINKNNEILKCIIYHLYEGYLLDYISKITGKSRDSIERYEKLIYKEKVVEKL